MNAHRHTRLSTTDDEWRRCISSLTGADLLAGPLRKKALGKGNAEKLMYGHCTGSNGHRRLTIRPEDAVFRSPMPRTCNLSREPLHTCIAFLLPPAGLSESCRPRLESSPAPRPVSCADGPRDAPLQCIAELSVTNWILSTSPRIGLGVSFPQLSKLRADQVSYYLVYTTSWSRHW